MFAMFTLNIFNCFRGTYNIFDNIELLMNLIFFKNLFYIFNKERMGDCELCFVSIYIALGDILLMDINLNLICIPLRSMFVYDCLIC